MTRAVRTARNPRITGAVFVVLACWSIQFAAIAQEAASSPPPSASSLSPSAPSSSPSDYVSRAEYEKLKAEHEALKQEMEALKAAVQQMANGTAPAVPTETPAPKVAETAEVESGKQVATVPSTQAVTPSTAVEAVSTEASSGPLATHNFSIVGDAEFQFAKISHQHGAFELADFAPIFLFRGGEKVLFEAGFDFIIQNNAPGGSGYTTTVNLSFATLDYLINDYVTFVGGNMLLPLGTYSERSAGWLNKFPDAPLPRSILPGTGVGAQLRGAIPLGEKGASLSYSGFVVNGPGSVDGSGNAGQLDLGGNVGLTSDGKFANLHGGAGEGGRIAVFFPWKPTYDLEVGVSGMSSPWDNAGKQQYSALVADWALHVGPFVEIKGEYMNTWVGTDNAGTIDPDGWWIQAGYKLSGLKLNVPYLDKLELVGRYDTVDDGLGSRTNRGTIGGVYYITNTLWLEGDYEFTSNHGPNPAPDDSLIFQISYGF